MVVHWPSWRSLLLPLHNIHKHTQTLSVNMSDLYMEMVWFGIGGCQATGGTSVALGVRDVLSHICTYLGTWWIIVRKWKLGPPARLPVQCWLRALSVFLSPSLSHTHCTAAVFLHWAIHLWAPAVNSTGNWKHKHAPAQSGLTSFLRSYFFMLYFNISHKPALAAVMLIDASSDCIMCVLRVALCANVISTLS